MSKPKFVNIVVIGDDPVDTFIAKQLLKRSCDKIKTYKNGKVALDGLERSVIMPELILLDINMPEMNGFEFLAAFEKLPEERKNFTTIYMLTSSDDEGDKEKAMRYDSVKKFITKPLSLKEFV